ncbi:L-threonine O-3-phosphate decarboxylase [Caloranaerobacter azorensis DSM 13643]|uniref:threonine-phosphate decarboxylase n=1 Tax=Caloranaerobacter azorensis DSM 13643 TaxID=1121264 RepID=A0A1M5R8P4_9FIRM|nr:threonine-phosphate decarboxylase CobD [Caloranaerobacter azorensis]SHH22591.1 L-threonine O-3-phosphate decarboxylase [Caloranaerobacter azorensis DSM 13643]
MNKHGGYYGENKEKVLDFSVNINPLGVTERVKEKLIESINIINRYPEIDGESAKKVLADRLSIEHSEVIIGNGATELIYLFARAFSPKKVVIIQPTFNEYFRAFRLTGSRICNYELTYSNDFKLEVNDLLDYLKDINPNVLVICNPNNPTGYFIRQKELLPVVNYIREIGSYLLLDESFIDFTDEKSYVNLIKEFPIFILRSMTKFYSVPGLRLGYGVANSEIIKKLNEHKEPWTINSFALSIVSTILDDEAFYRESKKWLQDEKNYLYKELKEIRDIDFFNSQTNFILCKVKKGNAYEVREKLMQYNIYIRVCDDFIGLDNTYFRIAIKSHKDNIKLINAIKKVL